MSWLNWSSIWFLIIIFKYTCCCGFVEGPLNLGGGIGLLETDPNNEFAITCFFGSTTVLGFYL